MVPIEEITLSSFDEIRRYFDLHYAENRDDFVFRGQAKKEWRLESTLRRLIINARKTGAKDEGVNSFVAKHLDRFKIEIKGRRGINPPKLEDDEIWALGQHYGLATPLLDWSNSPYISLFFAFSDFFSDDQRRCVWALNKSKVQEINKAISNDSNKMEFFIPESEDNERIISQSGLFTKGPVMMSVDQWVNHNHNLVGGEPALVQIEIPEIDASRKEILSHLDLMNIKYSTVFPDLIGASRYCNIKAENYEI